MSAVHDSASRMYVGCYTAASSVGVHVLDMSDLDDVGALGSIDAEQASFLTVRADTATLYAVRETADSGALVAMRIGDGSIEVIDEVPSLGSDPCHVSTSLDRIYVANYSSGTVASYRLRPDGGFGDLIGHHRHEGDGPHARQEAPHAHCIVPGPDRSFVYAADLGTDQVIRYEHARGGTGFEPVDVTAFEPGSGPRHLTFHPHEPVAFVVCELSCTVVVADLDTESGRLHPRAPVSTLPPGVDGSIAAEVTVHPDGRHVYVSNRGADTIAAFSFDPTGGLDALGHVPSGGHTPRHIAIDPSGRRLFAANQDSGTIVSFEFDESGVPRQLGVVAELSQPVCLAFGEPVR